MTNGTDPIDELRAADPVRPDEVPEASLARMTASVQEHMMSQLRRDPTRVPPTRGPLAIVGGLTLAGALALAVIVGPGLGIGGGGSASAPPVAVAPTPTEDP